MSHVTEKLIDNYTPAEQRGADAYKQIRDKVNQLRFAGIEPKTIWVGKQTGDDMKALWKRACGAAWDEILPKMIAGVRCEVGSIGGHDWQLEYYPPDVARAMRQRSTFNAVDNPLQGIH